MNVALKITIAAVVVGSFAAATVGAMSAPRAASNTSVEVSVNRTNKADRLESVLARATQVSAPRQSNMSVGRRPVGCEPAFSPLAEPGRRQFFGRCVS